MAGFLHDPPTRWRDARILVIGHVATKRALDIHLRGASLHELAAAGFAWREGSVYETGGGA